MRDPLRERLAHLQGWGIALLRIMVGLVFIVHGVQKLFQFGIGGFAANLEGLGVPLPVFFSTVVTLVEILCGAALILGIFTRWVAIPLAIDMLAATLLVHVPNGFFAANGGYEFTLTLLVANVSLVLSGSGALALDNALASRGDPADAPAFGLGDQGRRATGSRAESRGPDDS